jgi:hypothetical protein
MMLENMLVQLTVSRMVSVLQEIMQDPPPLTKLTTQLMMLENMLERLHLSPMDTVSTTTMTTNSSPMYFENQEVI